MVVSCEARCFPYPRYQWYRGRSSGKGEITWLKIDATNGQDKEFRFTLCSDHDNTYLFCCVYKMCIDDEQKLSQQEHSQPCLLSVNAAKKPNNAEKDLLDQQGVAPLVVESPAASKHVEVGGEVELTCFAVGFPGVKYQWMKDGVALLAEHGPNALYSSKDSKLVIAPAAIDDEGVYVCEVRNTLGQTWSGQCRLAVSLPTAIRNLVPGCKPHIIQQPVAPSGNGINIGATFQISCFAVDQGGSRMGISYQWFKDKRPLPHSNNPSLLFSCAKQLDSGTYVCEVSNQNGRQRSDAATINISDKNLSTSSSNKQKFYATDKIALLIGNTMYPMYELVTPRFDTFQLAQLLELLHFKVIKVMNYNKREMEEIISKFCKLLGKGVYAVVYYSGHGFECNGECYMVPIDSHPNRPDECISESWMLGEMQQKDTRLNLLLLDMCRTANDTVFPTPRSSAVSNCHRPPNVMKAYSTCSKWKSYEGKGAKYSLFMTYLLPHIMKEKPFCEIFRMVMEDMKKAKVRQQPEFSCNMPELVSLTDPIKPDKDKGDHWTRQQAVAIIKTLPNARKEFTVVFDGGVSAAIHIKYYIHFSNVLGIGVKMTALTEGLRDVQVKEVHGLPLALTAEIEPVRSETEAESHTYIYILHLQRLCADLEPALLLTASHHGTPIQHTTSCGNLRLPLIAQLNDTVR